MIYTILLIFNLQFSFGQTPECQKWFDKTKIKSASKDCLLVCNLTPTSWKTLHCPGHCPKLCKTTLSQEAALAVAKLYPSSNKAEQAFVATDPEKIWKAYTLSWSAENICEGIYPVSIRNDESDACRHFVWAGLLTNEFQRDFADKVLTSHEQEPDQPTQEKAMDLANNQRGISAAENLLKGKNFSEKSLLLEFQKELNQGKIIVLKRNYDLELK